MDAIIQFLLRHGGVLLFGVVFVEQVGFPLPAFPFLLAAGAVAAAGKMRLAAAVGLPVMAAVIGDLLWYYLGRRRGSQVLNLLCRISLEPDSCVRRTEDIFARTGVRSLLFAKFIPGLSTVTPPLAGIFGVTLQRFLLYDFLGALLWTESGIGLGYLFSNQLERVATYAGRTGSMVGVSLGGAAAAYIACKWVQRQRFLRELRVARVSADDLRQMLDAGEEVLVVDLRHRLDVEAVPYGIPGALRLTPEEVSQRHHEIPRDRDVILYCTWPNEATSARVALLLRRNGITKVRPLAGGLEAWRERNLPLESLRPAAPATGTPADAR